MGEPLTRAEVFFVDLILVNSFVSSKSLALLIFSYKLPLKPLEELMNSFTGINSLKLSSLHPHNKLFLSCIIEIIN
jgi:hypothetical protein